jgi:hypothetical protein
VIIQRVIRGVSGISQTDAQTMLDVGIQCSLCYLKGQILYEDIPKMLTERNLEWHQDRPDDLDPLYNNPVNEQFRLHTPFISTTAGTVERRKGQNVTRSAFDIALRFATNGLLTDGYLFYCDLFVLGRPAVALQAFAEELRELNINPRYSVYQVEGEIVAKIIIPPAQIERADFFDITTVNTALSNGQRPTPDPTRSLTNGLYVNPSRYSNVRTVLA